MVIEKKAFTLIELLVTIAVIAILAGLLLPTLNSARERVKTISCLNNEKSLGVALIQYSMDNDYYFPMSGYYLQDWHHGIAPYLGYHAGNEGKWKLFVCPDDPRKRWNGMLSYGLIRALASRTHGSSDWEWGSRDKIIYFKRPSATYALTDRNFHGHTYNTGTLTVSETNLGGLGLWTSATVYDRGSVIWSIVQFGPLHNQRRECAMLYLDGHTRSIRNWNHKFTGKATYALHKYPDFMVEN